MRFNTDWFAAAMAFCFFGGALLAIHAGHSITGKVMLVVCLLLTLLVYGRSMKNDR